MVEINPPPLNETSTPKHKQMSRQKPLSAFCKRITELPLRRKINRMMYRAHTRCGVHQCLIWVTLTSFPSLSFAGKVSRIHFYPLSSLDIISLRLVGKNASNAAHLDILLFCHLSIIASICCLVQPLSSSIYTLTRHKTVNVKRKSCSRAILLPRLSNPIFFI